MGTDSDRTSFLKMFLAYETAQGESVFGFYRSKEGREFLRHLFRPYLRRQSMGEGKAATIIADSYADPDKQDREVDRTKSALRRWSRDGQSELWPKDQEKNMRCIRRLENEYLSVAELREVLEDTAETIQKHQSGIALANFFYGALPVSRADDSIDELQSKTEGLYDVKRLRWIEATDPFEKVRSSIIAQLKEEVRKHGVAPNVIQIDPNMFDFSDHAVIDTRETPGYVEYIPAKSRFVRLSAVEDRNFMILQSFEVEFDDGDVPRPRRVSTGYAFPMSDGTLHVLQTDSEPPSHRSYVAFSPDELARPYGTISKEGDRSWKIARHPFAQGWEALYYGERAEFWRKVSRENHLYAHIDVDKLSAQLDLTMWNFIP